MVRDKELQEMSQEELRQAIKERLWEKKKYLEEIKTTAKKLQELKVKEWRYEQSIASAKYELGKRRGARCPALKRTKESWSELYTCVAKNFKRNVWYKSKMYRLHCFACKLTPKQAKTAMHYQVILFGRKNRQ